MKKLLAHLMMLCLLAVIGLPMTGCAQQEAGMDENMEEQGEVMEETTDDMGGAMEDTGDEMEDTMDEAGEEMDAMEPMEEPMEEEPPAAP